MRELVIHPAQSRDPEAQIEEVVQRLEALDLALGCHLAGWGSSPGPARRRPRRERRPSVAAYRARIGEWCRDPAVRAAFGTDAVLTTAQAVPHLTDDELLAFVRDLIDRASAAPLRTAGENPRGRRAG